MVNYHDFSDCMPVRILTAELRYIVDVSVRELFLDVQNKSWKYSTNYKIHICTENILVSTCYLLYSVSIPKGLML